MTRSVATWRTPVAVDARAGLAANAAPKIAVDGRGNYIAVWSESNSSSLRGIWQSTSADGVIWPAPEQLTTTVAQAAAVAVNADGVTVVAWSEIASNLRQVAARVRSTPSSAWSAIQIMRAGDDANDRLPAVAVSSAGDSFVVWEQVGGTANMTSIWMSQFTGGAWMPAALFESHETGASTAANIATNSTGGAVVTYLQRAGATSQLWARRLAPGGGGFQPPLMVAEGSSIDSVPPPSVTLDPAGTATVSWAFAIAGRYNVHVSRAAAADPAWPAAVPMETDNQAQDDTLTRGTNSTVRSDTAGNVVVVWRKRTPTRFDVWARRFVVADGAWGTSTLLETVDTVGGAAANVFAPALAVAGNGTAFAVWNYGGTGVPLDVYANVLR